MKSRKLVPITSLTPGDTFYLSVSPDLPGHPEDGAKYTVTGRDLMQGATKFILGRSQTGCILGFRADTHVFVERPEA